VHFLRSQVGILATTNNAKRFSTTTMQRTIPLLASLCKAAREVGAAKKYENEEGSVAVTFIVEVGVGSLDTEFLVERSSS
jgi:hypothetical protein